MSEKTRIPQTDVAPTAGEVQLQPSMQMSLAEFAAQFNVQKPHADIARMNALFSEMPAKSSGKSSFEVFPLEASKDGAPVRLARVIDRNKGTGSELLDEGDSTTYYIFVGNSSKSAFAQISQSSSKWGQINLVNQIEELNEENVETVNRILTILEKNTNTALTEKRNAHDAKVKKVKEVSKNVGIGVGSVALIGAVLIGSYKGVTAAFRWGATNEREMVENFDNQWGDRSLGNDYEPVDMLQKASTVAPDDLLKTAPGFGAYDASIAGPRKTSVSASTCSTTSGVNISPTDKISVVTMEPTKTTPISYYADSTNDKIIFCNFGGGSSREVYFDIRK